MICDFKTASRSSEPMQIANEVQLTSYAYLLRHHNQWAESGLEIRSLIKTKVPKVEFHPYPPSGPRISVGYLPWCASIWTLSTKAVELSPRIRLRTL